MRAAIGKGVRVATVWAGLVALFFGLIAIGPTGAMASSGEIETDHIVTCTAQADPTEALLSGKVEGFATWQCNSAPDILVFCVHIERYINGQGW
jgi:hypothetical protein